MEQLTIRWKVVSELLLSRVCHSVIVGMIRMTFYPFKGD